MAGLLDFIASPEGQGLLSGAFGYAANARRGAPLNSIGRGGLAGLAGYANALELQKQMADAAQMKQLRDMQIAQANAQIEDQNLEKSTAAKYFTPAVGGLPGMGQINSSLPPELQAPVVQPAPGKPALFDIQGFANERLMQNPSRGIALLQAIQKETPINKLDVKDFTPASVQKFKQTGNYADLERLDKLHFADTGGGIVGVNQFTGQPINTLPKTGNPFTDLVISSSGGGYMPNAPLVGVKKDIANAGAARTNVSVNTDKSYFGNVAEGLAKNDVALIDAARSAPDRIASAQRVREVLAKNPITGTGAEVRLSLNKALATAGLVDGTNVANTEVLASTLASQTLDAIKTSGLGGGQGFTDKDRQFLERAKSGNIEMTPQALGQIADLNERSARAAIKRGNSVINKMRASPEAGRMGQQLDVIEEPAAAPQAGRAFAKMPTANTSNRGKFLTDSETGKRYQSNGMQWVEIK